MLYTVIVRAHVQIRGGHSEAVSKSMDVEVANFRELVPTVLNLFNKEHEENPDFHIFSITTNTAVVIYLDPLSNPVIRPIDRARAINSIDMKARGDNDSDKFVEEYKRLANILGKDQMEKLRIMAELQMHDEGVVL